MFDETKVTITKCDNGYVLEWQKPYPKNSMTSGTNSIPVTSGTEVYSTRKKVMDAADSRLS
jgi:hypothetical protein